MLCLLLYTITLLLTTSTNSQQVINLAEEFLDYNDDEVNISISPEVVDIAEKSSIPPHLSL